MREYNIDARNIKNPFYPSPIHMSGCDDKGKELAVGNYFLTLDGEPFFAVCGEAHFSRMNEALWEDEIIKMKLGGVNIIAGYIFWIHHEETEGEFDWNGNKNLRRFLTLCKKNNMYVILRIGPFSHGECRNGGFPDWLFGRPFDLRCDDETYLKYTERFYKEIYRQAEGLLFKDGGPVIGVQLENEHEHASCPWELTTENSKEWLVSGREGQKHMATLKALAKKAGFDVPLYTATAWGGACAPEQIVLPLWGGYAFRPWMFYDGKLKEHPATGEYLYGDFHCNTAPKYYNFDPEYPAEDYPYACCEMGGGMNVYYPYRFQLPMESVGAMAQVKAGSGCNFLGYYMYHGGTHPKGKKIPWLNECDVPKFSYDYQAPLGEFGQVRKSFHQLKLQHLFYQEFQKEVTATKTVLSKEAVVQQPEDVETLRYVVRVDEAGQGFLFINNYQDHVEGIEQKDFAITVQTDRGVIRVPEEGALNLPQNGFAIWPLWFDFHGHPLKYATAQLVTKVLEGGSEYFFFVQTGNSQSEFVFEEEDIVLQPQNGCRIVKNKVILTGESCCTFRFTGKDGTECIICTLPEPEGLRLWQIDAEGKRRLFLSDDPILYKDGSLELEYHCGENLQIGIFPPADDVIYLGDTALKSAGTDGVFQIFESFQEVKELPFTWKDVSTVNKEGDGALKRPVVGSPLTSTKVVNGRAVLQFDPKVFADVKQVLLKVCYEGDVGYAFIEGEMFHDNFCNGAPWEIDLMPYKEQLLKHGMYLYVSPRKIGAYVDSTSSMAALHEVIKEQIARINSIELAAIKRIEMTFPTP